MAFLLRTVSRSAEGREIVRARRVEGDRLTIGRDPRSDVHLTDLAVALAHAAVERAGDRLDVAVEAGLSVELNGRKSSGGIIDLASGGDLLIGSHLLRFMPTPAGSDDVAVAVERVTESEVRLDRSAERLFTLAPVLPGKRILAWLLALLVLGLGLAWPIKAYYDRQQRAETFARFHADRLWSSGSLSTAHAGLSDDCTACHVEPFEAVRDTACKTCHTTVHDHADPFRLARAKPDPSRWRRIELAFKERFDIPPGRCVECHVEHEGRQAMPATAQRFCADCHGDLDSKLRDTGLADAGDFGRSHPEFQPVAIAGWKGGQPLLRRFAPAQRKFEDSGLKFPHALHLSLTNGVAQMARR
ncbi:MAG TPA: cytochrome c3 family protein, partial [Allosphingosinicella sp.]|nr:cytochrome c3 family protein [Allosphingosinicella sp.]